LTVVVLSELVSLDEDSASNNEQAAKNILFDLRNSQVREFFIG